MYVCMYVTYPSQPELASQTVNPKPHTNYPSSPHCGPGNVRSVTLAQLTPNHGLAGAHGSPESQLVLRFQCAPSVAL